MMQVLKTHTAKGDKKLCPPANLGFCAALMASLWDPVLEAVAYPPPLYKCSSYKAFQCLLSASTLHMVSFCVMFGKRPIEVLRMERYVSAVIPWVDPFSARTQKPCNVRPARFSSTGAPDIARRRVIDTPEDFWWALMHALHCIALIMSCC